MTNRTPVVAEYLALVRDENLEAATAYLQEAFMTGEGDDAVMNEEALNKFMEEVVATAEAETQAEETTEVTEEAPGAAEETANEAEVQEATSES